MKWKQVSEFEVHAHPLYGIKGWLIAFSVFVVLGIGGDLYALVTLPDGLDPRLEKYFQAAGGYGILYLSCILWMLFTKDRRFRRATIALLLASWPIKAAIAIACDAPEVIDQTFRFSRWVMSSGMWSWYLYVSTRVRVTFDHCVPASTGGAPGLRSAALTAPAPPVVAKTTAPPPTMPALAALPIVADEEDLWAAAAEELETSRRPGLWAKAFAHTQGNDAAARAAYLNWRVTELRIEVEESIARARRERQAEEERRRLAAEAEEARHQGACSCCGQIMSMTKTECFKCRAIFGKGSAYRLTPCPETS